MTQNLPDLNNCSIAVLGLGYVGLPLAVEFAKSSISYKTGLPQKHQVIGFDLSIKRINELIDNNDISKQLTSEELKNTNSITFTNNQDLLKNVDVYIVCVPTPINKDKTPDFSPLKKVTTTIGKILKERELDSFPIIIYESTVYPGATEEICVPIIENNSKLKYGCDFFCGYSPERINPGDKKYTLPNITKVTSGSNEKVAEWIDHLYGSIIKAGTFSTKSIKVAEAAKVIENIQRDLNIALINELAKIFITMNINPREVFDAAKTKWNFLDFSPGLVGGHCLGVDPYYLTYKAQMIGFETKLVNAGRETNENMTHWIIQQLILEMAKQEYIIGNSNALIMGFAFKANCTDIRNTKVFDLIKELNKYKINCTIFDPIVDSEEVLKEYNLKILSEKPKNKNFSSVIVAVDHDIFREYSLNKWESILPTNSINVDIKGILPKEIEAIRIS